jgi:hypothetical protein
MTMPVMIWLGIMSWFDIKSREIPHSAWVIVPFIGALIYRTILGGWQLVVLAILVALVSERVRLAKLTELHLDQMAFWLPPLGVISFISISINPVGSLAILGFWIAWELHCWGGADAVTAMTLALVWPGWILIIALLSVHLVVALVATVYSFILEHRFRLHSIPGLPLLFATVVVLLFIPK